MKRIISLLLAVFALFAIMSCSDPANQPPNQDQEQEQEQEQEPTEITTTLTVASKNISAIAPYVYESASASKPSSKGLSAVPLDGQSYLSYIGPDSIGFQPLVFESSTGTKVIFEGTELYNIGKGYYICRIRNIQTIKEVPEVHYREAGIDEETKEIIYEPYEMLIEVFDNLGENYAIFDVASGEIYLLKDPYKWDSGIWVDVAIINQMALNTQNTIYLVGRTYDGDKSILYKIDKGNIQAGLEPLSNSSVIRWPYVKMGSDEIVIYDAETTSADYYTLVQGSSSESTPYRFEPDYFTISITDENGTEYKDYGYPQFDRMLVEGNIIHAFSLINNKLIVMDYEYTGEKILKKDYQIIPLQSHDVYNIDLMASENISGGAKGIFKLYGDDATAFLKVTCTNGNITTDEVIVPPEYNEIDSVEIVGDRIYWADGVFTAQSAICYADFTTHRVKSKEVMGKTIASPKINVSDDGTVTYWQYMSGKTVGTFSWNIDKEPEPRLLMVDETDVQQVINIATL